MRKHALIEYVSLDNSKVFLRSFRNYDESSLATSVSMSTLVYNLKYMYVIDKWYNKLQLYQ